MKRISFPLLFLVLCLTACSSDIDLEPGVVHFFRTQQQKGFLIPCEDDNSKAHLYVWEDELYPELKHVDLAQRSDGVYISGEDFAFEKCLELEPYDNPALCDIGDTINYCDERFDINTVADVEYGKADGFWTTYPDSEAEATYIQTGLKRLPECLFSKELSLTMDIYEPDDDEVHECPVLVMIHGGAFYNGDKADEEYKLWCEKFARAGYLAVSVNYRLGYEPSAAFIERAIYRATQDVNAAIRYLIVNKDVYNIDPNRIFVTGCSAGAITALGVAFMTDEFRPKSTYEGSLLKATLFDENMGGITAIPVMGDNGSGFVVRAVGNMWGAVTNLEMLNTSTTAIISFHDYNDPIVPFTKGFPFVETIGANGYPLMEAVAVHGMDIVDFMVGAFPKLYGSGSIHDYLNDNEHLYPFTVNKHAVIRDADDSLNSNHQFIFEKMTEFFKEKMIGNPVELVWDSTDKKVLRILDPADVDVCSWTVKGGVVARQISQTSVELQVFSEPAPDGGSKCVTVTGKYNSGIPFEVTLDL